jgi:hypothetical protein
VSKCPEKSSFGRSLEFRYCIDRGHSPLPCISFTTLNAQNWTFPAEMITAALVLEREKVIKPSHRFEIR